MKNIEIKKVTINDIVQLQSIGRQTFYETFSEVNTEENMKKYLADSFSIQKITDEVNNEHSQFYFAKLDNKITGYLKINFGTSQTELKDEKALEIERIYVLKEFQGKKLGQILYEKAIIIAKHKNSDYIWLDVWGKNKRAVNFYKKKGVVEFDKHIFKLGDDEQTDIMMKKNLKMNIRRANKQTDYDKVWDIFRDVIVTGDTYTFDPNTPKDSLEKYWFANYMDTFVAEDENGAILGTYIIKPNQIDLGNHIANCSYMVSPKHQGKGIGKLLCEHSINFAKDKGYLGIQFNIVVSTNENAVKLWQKFGFEIIGTTPKGFRHKELGLVDTYIMYKDLQTYN